MTKENIVLTLLATGIILCMGLVESAGSVWYLALLASTIGLFISVSIYYRGKV